MALNTFSLWLLFLLPLSLFLLVLKKKQVRRLNFPPSPPKLPIIGNLHQLGNQPYRSLWQLSRKYGPIMLLQLGHVPTLVVSSVETAREVLKTHDLECCSRPNLVGPKRLSYNFLDVAFVPYGEYWKEMRRICTLELLSSKRVQSFRFIREEEVALMIKSISQSSSTPINLTEKLFSLTDDIVCRIAFGKSYQGRGFEDGRFQEVIYEAMAMLGSFFGTDFFPSMGWIIDKFTGLDARLEKSFHELDVFYQRVIDEHLNPERPKPEHEDIIDVLLGLGRDQMGAIHLSHGHIKAILMNIFLAGVESSAVTQVWAMTELAKNPRVMKKVQDEVRNCVRKKGRVDEDDVAQLQFLKMVVKETLRLHPPGPLLIPRETIRHIMINGYDIYPKTRILVNVWGLSRDPKYWANPELFYPERFIDNSIDFKGQYFEFLPFGAGRRGCPGMYMGIASVELALANLIYSFNWELSNGMKEEDINMDESAGISVHKKSPLYLVPIKYNWHSEEKLS